MSIAEDKVKAPGPRVTLIVFAHPVTVPGVAVSAGPTRLVRPGKAQTFAALGPEVTVPVAFKIGGEIVMGGRHFPLAGGLIESYEIEE